MRCVKVQNVNFPSFSIRCFLHNILSGISSALACTHTKSEFNMLAWCYLKRHTHTQNVKRNKFTTCNDCEMNLFHFCRTQTRANQPTRNRVYYIICIVLTVVSTTYSLPIHSDQFSSLFLSHLLSRFDRTYHLVTAIVNWNYGANTTHDNFPFCTERERNEKEMKKNCNVHMHKIFRIFN